MAIRASPGKGISQKTLNIEGGKKRSCTKASMVSRELRVN
jgi:hypothetical protein